jgi:HD-GYP domain-containing protein (c-di-GMP phosphodiesterase class II)
MIEDEDQLQQLRAHCKWAMVDTLRSVGGLFEAPKKEEPASRRDAGVEPRVTVNRAAAPRPAATVNTAIRQAKDGAPVGKPPANPHARETPATARSREFAVSVPGSRGRPGATPAGAEGNGPGPGGSGSDTDAPGRGMWGKLREGVSSLFAKREREKPDLDSVSEQAEAQETPKRPGFIPESVQLTIYEDQKPVEEEIEAAGVAFQRTSELLHSLVDDIRAGNDLQLDSVEEVISDMVDSMVRNPDALMWVARMREQDLTVYGHGLAVAVSLVAFGRHLGYPKEQLAQLGMLGLLLDIGKIKLPRELLEKNARLSSDEFELIKKHVELGMKVLAQTPNIHPDVLEGIVQHHERMNGSGYPHGLMGDRIGVFGRMAAIADTYAAVTKSRPYAPTISPHEALQMLSNWGGTQFQADMVEQYIQSIGVFPVGSLVELSTGEIAVVVTHNKQKRLRPKVLVVTAVDKTPNKHPAMRDLLYDVSDHATFIRRGLPSNSYGIDPSEFYLQ